MNFIRTSRSFKRFITNVPMDKAFLSASSSTGLLAYDSRSKKKIPMMSREDGIITWYICGPTVYDDSHIGHAWYLSERFYTCNMKFYV